MLTVHSPTHRNTRTPHQVILVTLHSLVEQHVLRDA